MPMEGKQWLAGLGNRPRFTTLAHRGCTWGGHAGFGMDALVWRAEYFSKKASTTYNTTRA